MVKRIKHLNALVYLDMSLPLMSQRECVHAFGHVFACNISIKWSFIQINESVGFSFVTFKAYFIMFREKGLRYLRQRKFADSVLYKLFCPDVINSSVALSRSTNRSTASTVDNNGNKNLRHY